MSSVDYVHPNDVMLPGRESVPQWYLIRSVNPPTHPAVMGRKMPPHYVLSDQRSIERVPHPGELDSPGEGIAPITFSVNGWPGVRVRDIRNNTVTIDAANDAVFAEYGWRLVTIDLEWPGYERKSTGDPMSSKINVRPGGRYITRQNFAQEICGLLSSFHKAVTTQRRSISPEHEKWALTAGSEGIRVQDIVLLSAHYHKNNNDWVPEFYVIE